ncbi:hypothetical protein L9F63_014720 [Diploptera punctata]|uniref:WD repeat-containing protein 73 n=1 Tax=Diploptera punctata TaxID=6984 RepID=A0AAD8A8M5_DIPPU|nr:hypothetical protein L9F63_014720 [Diploptera punctata]
MHNMFLKDSDAEDEDEWFYDSIKRYKQLRMFDVEQVVRQVELSDERTMCVVGIHEILELSLPDKITVAPCQEGLVKNSDLKLRSGGYTTSPITQMRTLWNEKKILLSQEKQTGASLYTLGSEQSDLISRISILSCDLISPQLAVNNKGLALLTAKHRRDVILMDIEANKSVYNKSLPGNETEMWLEPCFMSETVVTLCNRYSGNVVLLDVRTDTLSQVEGDRRKTEDIWTMAVSAHNNVSRVGKISSSGKLIVHDLRHTQVPSSSYDLGKVSEDLPSLKFSPESCDVVSMSGFDDKVYVYDVSCGHEPNPVFVHDGHKHHSGCEGDNSVTCHTWYRDNTIISAAMNSSLHCWQFIPLVT